MATLTQIIQSTRTILKWAAVLFFVFLIIRFILFPIGLSFYNRLFPKEPPAPTTAFGKLLHVQFPKKAKPAVTFTLQTTTGGLPETCRVDLCQKNEDPTQPVNIPDRIAVYLFERRQAAFASLDQARRKVEAIGFKGEGVALSPTLYQWVNGEANERKIVFNIITQTFNLTTRLATSSAQISDIPPQREQAGLAAKTFLSAMSLLPQDIDDTKTKVTFLRIRNGQLVRATSLSESDFVQVDLYRKNLNNLPILQSNPSQSLLSFLIQGGQSFDQKRIAQAHYSYKSIDTQTFSTYPIKGASEAFEELKQGSGFVVSEVGRGTASVHKVYLAYYEGDDTQGFLLPIFVFEGDNFIAFVEAITADWLQ